MIVLILVAVPIVFVVVALSGRSPPARATPRPAP
jgi:hypothetical protein